MLFLIACRWDLSGRCCFGSRRRGGDGACSFPRRFFNEAALLARASCDRPSRIMVLAVCLLSRAGSSELLLCSVDSILRSGPRICRLGIVSPFFS